MDDERAGLIVKDILDGLRDVILRHGVTYPEYRRAIQFLAAAGERGELPLLCDVLLESVVDETTARAVPPGATDSNVEGPFFSAGAPELGPSAADGTPVPLPMRPDEPGDALVFSGTVRSTAGDPLPGAVLDLWQADATGRYSRFAPGLPEWNLRGRVATGDDGGFAIRTVVLHEGVARLQAAERGRLRPPGHRYGKTLRASPNRSSGGRIRADASAEDSSYPSATPTSTYRKNSAPVVHQQPVRPSDSVDYQYGTVQPYPDNNAYSSRRTRPDRSAAHPDEGCMVDH